MLVWKVLHKQRVRYIWLGDRYYKLQTWKHEIQQISAEWKRMRRTAESLIWSSQMTREYAGEQCYVSSPVVDWDDSRLMWKIAGWSGFFSPGPDVTAVTTQQHKSHFRRLSILPGKYFHTHRHRLLTVWRSPGRPAPTGRPGEPGPGQREPEGPRWLGSPEVEGNRPASGPGRRNSWEEHPGRSWRWSSRMSALAPGSSPGEEEEWGTEIMHAAYTGVSPSFDCLLKIKLQFEWIYLWITF